MGLLGPMLLLRHKLYRKQAFPSLRPTWCGSGTIAEEKAAEVTNHLDDGCGVHCAARLVKIPKVTVAWLLRWRGIMPSVS